MSYLINTGILLVAILHIGFFYLETFLWQKPFGRKVFRLDEEFARKSAGLAANQGLYNLFLSAGLFWSVLARDSHEALQLKFFFLSCVALAGIYGALTVSKRIFILQGLLPLILLLALFVKN